MPALLVFGYLAALAIGLVLGLMGGGGSILAVPAFAYLFGMDAVPAKNYSLFVVGVTALVGAWRYARQRQLDVKAAALFGLPSMLVAFGVGQWVEGLPADFSPAFGLAPQTLTRRMAMLGLFAVLMVLAALRMLRSKGGERPGQGSAKPTLLVAQGVVVGALTAFVGAGGGFLIVPALVLLARLPMKVAAGTSLLIIAANSLASFGGALSGGFGPAWPFLLGFTALTVAGILLGVYATRYFSGQALKRGFGVLVLVMGVFILLKELVFAPPA